MDRKLAAVPVVVYEDNHLIAIHKPHGMPSQSDETGDLAANEWVSAYLRETYQKPGNVYVGLLHRLDRPAAGLLLLAKTSKAAERMSAQFQKGLVNKKYMVGTLAVPHPRAGKLEHFVGPVPGNPHIMRAYPQPGADRKVARLSYLVLAEADGKALLEVDLDTGRKHQIRVQLAERGCGVIGDMRYNRTAPLPDQAIALLSWKMEFEHPVRKGETIRLAAPLPADGGPFGNLLSAAKLV